MRKFFMLVYGAGAYAVSLASLLYIMGFLADVGVPKGISDGAASSFWRAVFIDAALIGVFGLHHSITARTSFKRWWTQFMPPPMERATYLYMTAMMTALLVGFWAPLPITLWQAPTALATGLMFAIYSAIWLMMLAATFHFGHFDFFGLAQAWRHFRQTPPASANMTARYLYALVRHPISLGWMLAPLATPHLTAGHLVFAGASFIYIVLATPFEEADLVDEIGQPYVDYQKRVPRFAPFTKGRPGKAS